MSIKINIFGEAHFHKDEVSNIQNSVIKLKPDIILLENYEDDVELYKIALPKTKIIELEDNVIFNEKDTLGIQFRDREFNMVKNIYKQIDNNLIGFKDVKICVVVGDTHLRTIKTKELGEPILFNGLKTINPNVGVSVNIHRSKYKEIE